MSMDSSIRSVGSARECLKSLQLEQECAKSNADSTPILSVHFPIIDITKDILLACSPNIDKVILSPQSAKPSYLVKLRNGVNIRDTMDAISKMPYGNGFMRAEQCYAPVFKVPSLNATDIDARTIYLGKLPVTMTKTKLEEYFPGAHEISVHDDAVYGDLQRYALISFCHAEKAYEAFRGAKNSLISESPIIIHFHRPKVTGTIVGLGPIAKTVIYPAFDLVRESHGDFRGRKRKMGRAKESPASAPAPAINGTRSVVPETHSLAARIKEEKSSESDVSDKDEINNSALGLRYREIDIELKQEQVVEEEEAADRQTNGRMAHPEIAYFQTNFDSDSDDDEPLQLTPTPALQKPQERKPNIQQLKRNCTDNNQHREFVRSLYRQVRQARETECCLSSGSRKDDLDGVFQQLNSDSEQEDF